MATLKMTGCMKLVSKMSEGDQDALLQRLDQYQADGVAPERAQLMAAQDILAEIQGERTQLFDLLKEQHADLFTVSEKPAAKVEQAPSAQFSRSRSPLGLSSALADSLDGIKTNAAPVQGWKDAIKGLLNKGAVKQDELEWSGVNDWLDLQQGKVTKDQVAQYLQQGGVQVEETVLGGASKKADLGQLSDEQVRAEFVAFNGYVPNDIYGDPMSREEMVDMLESASASDDRRLNTKYNGYQLPGGENYREVLLTLPSERDPLIAQRTAMEKRGALLQGNPNYAQDRATYDALQNKIKATQDYKSSHWEQPNVLAHIRTNDRTDADGNKVLFVEEIQSDWGQAGKKKGFREDAKQADLKAAATAARQRHEELYQALVREADSISDAEYQRRLDEQLDAQNAADDAAIAAGTVSGSNQEKLPRAPFVTKTEGWLNLALKRVMVMAAEGGYDKVAFVNGEQSAERYDLSKQVNRIDYFKRDDGKWDIEVQKIGERERMPIGEPLTEGKLADTVGKELAQKIVNSEGDPAPGGWTKLTGLDLKVGGEGMKAFYDQIVPMALKKLLPKVGGGQMGQVTLTNQREDFDLDALENATPEETAQLEAGGVSLVQPGFDVTPSMREKVASTGLPMFSPRRNMFGQAAPAATWLVPEDTYLDRNVIFQLQDKQVDLKRVIAAVKTAAGGLADKWDAYLQEELYHGRAAKATKDFTAKELRPLLEDMQSRGVSMAGFEEFLHNRHAEERNKQIAKINAAMPDGGSGIDTADARTYLAGLTPAKRRAFDALAARADAITAGTRQLLVASGLETQDTIDQWEGAYGNYVPLMREDLDYGLPSGSGTGQGFSVRGSSSRRATGSSRPVVDIMANLVMQRERVITRAEKVRVGTALYGLAVQNPNTDFWLAVDPASVKDPAKTIQDLVNLGINPLDAKNIIEEPKQTYTDPKTGLVTQRVNPAMRSADNVLAVRINGEDRYVFFNNNDERAKRMSATLKNLDGQQLNAVLGASAVVSRYFASINTQYNPIFGAINVLRDTQGAAFNLTTTPIADKKAEVLGGVAGAAKGIYQALRADRKGRAYPPGSWAQLWNEFQAEGGQTGFRDLFKDSNDRAKGLESELNKITEGTLKGAGRAIFDWLSDYNETLENAVRLSAYKAAKGKGLSNEQAASIAKNLTVNFNRKGNIGAQAGALYAFFNASVQGTARLAETLKGPAGKKILYGGLLLGSAQALLLAAADFDEDEPPDFIKERNLVIPTGDGKYLSLPMPLGLNVIPNTGRILTEWALSGGKDSGKRVAQITGAMLDMFNPIGNAGWSLQTLAPTAIDPLAALAENKDWSGRPIAKKDMSSTDPSPGFTRARDTASWISKQLSYVLNLASGGTDYKPGGFSPTPDQIDYLLGQGTGGVGREILKVSQAVESSVTGEDLPTYKVPLAGRFYGDTKEQSAVSSRYYANITELNGHERELKGRRENRGNAAEYLRDNPDARLSSFANTVERDVSKLRQRKREMLEKDRPADSIKMIELQISRRMKQLNDRVEEARVPK